MKTILVLILVVGGLFAAGLFIKHKKAQSKAALAVAAEQAEKVADAAAGLANNAAEALQATVTNKPVPVRVESPQVKPATPATHLQRLLQGEAPVARNMTSGGESIAAPGKPNLSRLLAAETTNSNR